MPAPGCPKRGLGAAFGGRGKSFGEGRGAEGRGGGVGGLRRSDGEEAWLV